MTTGTAQNEGTQTAIFDEIFRQNLWGSPESVSGPGSTLTQTRHLRENLPFLFARYGIGSILDIPCGDYNWMRHVPLGPIGYIGADVVPELVAANRKAHPEVDFRVMDLTNTPLPQVDLVLCRDCLFHLSFDMIAAALRNIRNSGSRWLLATTHTWLAMDNVDIVPGYFRKLNLRLPPFNLPPPLETIVEGNYEREGFEADRAMCLWSCRDL